MKIPRSPPLARIPDLVATQSRMDCGRPPLGQYYRFLVSCPEQFHVVAAARWDDIDLTAASWKVPRTGYWTGTFRPVSLPKQIVRVLSTLPRDSEWVFARPYSRKEHITEYSVLQSFASFPETQAWSQGVVRQAFMAWARSWVGAQGSHLVVRQPLEVLLHEDSTIFLNRIINPRFAALLSERDVVQAWADAVESAEFELNDFP